jgi:hypothetical protein
MRFAYVYVNSNPPPGRFHEWFGRSVVEAMIYGVTTACFRNGALLPKALAACCKIVKFRDLRGENARDKSNYIPNWQL